MEQRRGGCDSAIRGDSRPDFELVFVAAYQE